MKRWLCELEGGLMVVVDGVDHDQAAENVGETDVIDHYTRRPIIVTVTALAEESVTFRVLEKPATYTVERMK